ncbi:MAG TPA: hypothetical protein VLF67_02260 [Candidatus Saccharimonas sp.]|nr:hypothetical protein [Candidatus Saccharimonas sp.]
MSNGDIVKRTHGALQVASSAPTAVKVAGTALTTGLAGEVIAALPLVPAHAGVGTFFFSALLGTAMFYLGRMVGRGQR